MKAIYMNPDFSTPAKPLTAGVNRAMVAPHTTFFYEKPDGTIFMAEEAEAWRLAANRNQVLGRLSIPYKQVGVSDGHLFSKAVQEAQQIFMEKGLEAAQERLRRGEKEELEFARGHFQKPRNFDRIDTGGIPVYADGTPIPSNPRT